MQGRYPGPPRGPRGQPPHHGQPPHYGQPPHHGQPPVHRQPPHLHRPSPPIYRPPPFYLQSAYSPIHQTYRPPLDTSFRPPPPSRSYPHYPSHRPHSPIHHNPPTTPTPEAPSTSPVSISPPIPTPSFSPQISSTSSISISSPSSAITSAAKPPASPPPSSASCSSHLPSASQNPITSQSSISPQLSPPSPSDPPACHTSSLTSFSPVSTTAASEPTPAPQSTTARTPIRARLRSSSKPSNDQPIQLDSDDSGDQDPEYRYGGGNKRKSEKTGHMGKASKKKQQRDWREDFSNFDPVPRLPPFQPSKPSTSSASSFNLNLERVKFHNPNLDEKFVTRILSGVMDVTKVHWDDVCGLSGVKQRLKEMVVYPMLNPALFSGLRSPGRGLLLFGPPGTGKTLIGKCLATEARATFFSVSASTFGAKYYGEAEVLAKTLFECSKALQPSIIFMDEVDSILGNERENDGGCATRLRTELLTNMDGCQTTGTERVLIIGATNHPDKIDEAARRRFTRRLYIPLPDKEARKDQIVRMLQTEIHCLSEDQLNDIAKLTDGYSGADIAQVCRNASMEPIRSLDEHSLEFVTKEEVRAINVDDFNTSLKNTSKSVSKDTLKKLEEFDKLFGSK